MKESRKILSIGEFDNVTTENAIEILREAEEKVKMFNAYIEALNTDWGAQFYPINEMKMGGQNRFSKIIWNQEE